MPNSKRPSQTDIVRECLAQGKPQLALDLLRCAGYTKRAAQRLVLAADTS